MDKHIISFLKCFIDILNNISLLLSPYQCSIKFTFIKLLNPFNSDERGATVFPALSPGSREEADYKETRA